MNSAARVKSTADAVKRKLPVTAHGAEDDVSIAGTKITIRCKYDNFVARGLVTMFN